MAFNELIDGYLLVFGNATVSSLTVTNGQTVAGTLNATGTASVLSSSQVYFNMATFTLTASSTSTAQLSAATLNTRAGKVTTTALTSLATSTFSLLLTNSSVSASDMIVWSAANGTNTGTNWSLGNTLTSNGSMQLSLNTVSALNGTMVINFTVFK